MLLTSVIAFCSTALATCVILLTTSVHQRYTLDSSQGVQKVHRKPTPRVGGLGIVIGLALALPLHLNAYSETIIPKTFEIFVFGLLIFLVGLWEDISKTLSISLRIISVALIIFIATHFSEIKIVAISIPFVDVFLNSAVFCLLFTVFSLTGITNAFNLIDGAHGLAVGIALIAVSGVGLIAMLSGDWPLFYMSLTLASVFAGFLVVNFPSGRIFLGDGGAYLLGFLVGALTILLPARNPSVSPWVAVLLLAYPVIETLFTIYRRYRSRKNIAEPDSLHLHSLLLKFLLTSRLARKFNVNSLVAPPLWLLSSVPFFISINFSDSKSKLVRVVIKQRSGPIKLLS